MKQRRYAAVFKWLFWSRMKNVDNWEVNISGYCSHVISVIEKKKLKKKNWGPDSNLTRTWLVTRTWLATRTWLVRRVNSYHKEKAKTAFALKKTRLYSPIPNRRPILQILLSLFLATTSSSMQDWSRQSILSRSRVPLYEKYTTVIYVLGLTYEEYTVWISCRSNIA